MAFDSFGAGLSFDSSGFGAGGTGSSFSLFDGLSDFGSDLGSFATENKDLLGGLASIGKTAFDFSANRKDRKAEAQRFNKMFDFDRAQVDRTNRLEDERQRTIDSVFASPSATF